MKQAGRQQTVRKQLGSTAGSGRRRGHLWLIRQVCTQERAHADRKEARTEAKAAAAGWSSEAGGLLRVPAVSIQETSAGTHQRSMRPEREAEAALKGMFIHDFTQSDSSLGSEITQKPSLLLPWQQSVEGYNTKPSCFNWSHHQLPVTSAAGVTR